MIELLPGSKASKERLAEEESRKKGRNAITGLAIIKPPE